MFDDPDGRPFDAVLVQRGQDLADHLWVLDLRVTWSGWHTQRKGLQRRRV